MSTILILPFSNFENNKIRTIDIPTTTVRMPIITGDGANVSIFSLDNLPIYYTTNGNIPTIASTLYTTPFTIEFGTTVKAVCYDSLSNTYSSIAQYKYERLAIYTATNTPKQYSGAGENILTPTLVYEHNYTVLFDFYVSQYSLEGFLSTPFCRIWCNSTVSPKIPLNINNAGNTLSQNYNPEIVISSGDPSQKRFRIGFTHNYSTNTVRWKCKNITSGTTTGWKSFSNSPAQNTVTCNIGQFAWFPGNLSNRAGYGTLYELKIYDDILSDYEIESWINN